MNSTHVRSHTRSKAFHEPSATREEAMQRLNAEVKKTRDWFDEMDFTHPHLINEEGWETIEEPELGMYSILFRNKNNEEEIILSDSGEHEGANYPNEEWTMGFYDKTGQPVDRPFNGENETQYQFPNRKEAIAAAKKYMREHA
jgi:hypothetical protein